LLDEAGLAQACAHLAGEPVRRPVLHRTDPPTVSIWHRGRWHRGLRTLTPELLTSVSDVDLVAAHLDGRPTAGKPVRLVLDVAELHALEEAAAERGGATRPAALRLALDGELGELLVEPMGERRDVSLRIRPWERARWGDLAERLREVFPARGNMGEVSAQ
jgi:hypothetical protein